VPKKVNKSTKKLGRPEIIRPDELLNRYQELKQFLEHNWGRIGWELQRVRKPADVRTTFRLVPRIESGRPFLQQQPATCLLADGDTEIGKRELDLIRQQYGDAAATENRLWSEYHHGAFQRADDAMKALNGLISEFARVLSFCPFIFIICLAAKKLETEQLGKEASRLKGALKQAQENKRLLSDQLSSRNAWFARNEIVKFRKSTRYANTPINFAKIMAGLPEYQWLYSLRKCSKIRDESKSVPAYLLFEILQRIVKRTRPIDLRKIEIKLQDELLRNEAGNSVQSYVAPNWAYMKQAFAEVRGKRINRSELPYRIMGKFLDNVERPKTLPEIELAKREQL
jgi:hypothetical protein